LIGLIYDLPYEESAWETLMEKMHACVPEGHSSENLYHILLPHLERLERYEQQLSEERQQRIAMETTFKKLPIGVVCVNQQGVVLNINPYATCILQQCEQLTIKQGALKAFCPKQHRTLLKQLKRHGKSGNQVDSHLRFFDETSSQCKLHLHMFSNPQRTSGNMQEPSVTIFLAAQQHDFQATLQQLQKEKGLMASEVRVLHAVLTESGNLKDIAACLHLSHHTVRSHMQKIRFKLGCRYQSDILKSILLDPAQHVAET